MTRARLPCWQIVALVARAHYSVMVSADRPAIPRELHRRVLMESGHRCAIPTCRSTPVEIAHIVAWAVVRAHQFENLIALCPTCHTRYDQRQIDRRAMLGYKQALGDTQASTRLLTATRVQRYLEFAEAMDQWAARIQLIELHDVTIDSDAGRDDLVHQCRKAAQLASTRSFLLGQVCSGEVLSRTETVYLWVKRWADDVVDGLWPSTHPGADQHDLNDLGDLESDLEIAVADETSVPTDELRRLASRELPRLGGTGKRF